MCKHSHPIVCFSFHSPTKRPPSTLLLHGRHKWWIWEGQSTPTAVLTAVLNCFLCADNPIVLLQSRGWNVISEPQRFLEQEREVEWEAEWEVVVPHQWRPYLQRKLLLRLSLLTRPIEQILHRIILHTKRGNFSSPHRTWQQNKNKFSSCFAGRIRVVWGYQSQFGDVQYDGSIKKRRWMCFETVKCKLFHFLA